MIVKLSYSDGVVKELAAVLLSAEWDLDVHEVMAQWENLPTYKRNMYINMARKFLRKLAELTWGLP